MATNVVSCPVLKKQNRGDLVQMLVVAIIGTLYPILVILYTSLCALRGFSA